MTANQIEFNKLRETHRSNVARETETNRSNVANEGIKQQEADTHSGELAEKTRHNKAAERLEQGNQYVQLTTGLANAGAKLVPKIF